jgi:hypothetical protein
MEKIIQIIIILLIMGCCMMVPFLYKKLLLKLEDARILKRYKEPVLMVMYALSIIFSTFLIYDFVYAFIKSLGTFASLID